MSGFSLTPEQERAVATRGSALLVSAGAGSGKTRVLVERLMRWICDPVCPRNIDEFLIITYTKASAAELRQRIRGAIGARLAKQPDNRHLRRQLSRLRRAQISTIHAFCQKILRENSFDLLPAQTRVMDDAERAMMQRAVLSDLLDEQYALLSGKGSAAQRSEPLPHFADLERAVCDARGDEPLINMALTVFDKARSHVNPGRWLEAQDAAYRESWTVYAALVLRQVRRLAGHHGQALARVRSMLSEYPAVEQAYAPVFAAAAADCGEVRAAAGRGWDETWETLRRIEHPRLGSVRKFEDTAWLADVQMARNAWKKAQAELLGLMAGPMALHEVDRLATAPVISGLTALVLRFEERLRREKHRLGRVDFSDLEQLALSLLVDPSSGTGATPTAQKIAAQYAEIMVDEYQDINPLQERIIQAVSRGGGNLFMVGDVRQSIYRFRLADPGIFLHKFKTFADVSDEAEQAQAQVEPEKDCKADLLHTFLPGRKVRLTSNFRSRLEVLSSVNRLFARIMTEDCGEFSYTEDEYLRAEGSFPETGADYATELLVLELDGAARQSDEDEEKLSLALEEARMVADRIRGLIDAKFPVSDHDGGTKPVDYADICILARSIGGIRHAFSQALNERGIPVAGSETQNPLNSPEIKVVLAFLSLVDNPQDELSLTAALTAPNYRFSVDNLYALRQWHPDGSLYEALCAAASAVNAERAEVSENDFPGALPAEIYERAARFVDDLQRFRGLSRSITLYQLVSRVGAHLKASTLQAADPDGGDANWHAFLELACAPQARFGFFSFLRWIRKLRDSDLRTPGRNAVQNGVTLCSIHASKGLEYPVVIVADCAKKFNSEDQRAPILFHSELGLGIRRRETDRRVEYPTLARRAIAVRLSEEQSSEEMRLLYVAMTRAHEKLILSAALRDTWAAQCRKWQGSLSNVTVSQCRSFANWLSHCAAQEEGLPMRVVLKQLSVPDEPTSEAETVAPPASVDAARPVVFESPAEVQDDGAGLAGKQLRRLLTFSYPFEPACFWPSKVTVSELKGRLIERELDGTPEHMLGRAPPRTQTFRRARFGSDQPLTPAQRGTALHLALQHIRLDHVSDEHDIVLELDRLRQRGILTPEQHQIIEARRLHAFFGSPLGLTLRTAQEVRREFKFSQLISSRDIFASGPEEDLLLQGVIDCYCVSDGRLSLMDYKSDRVGADGLNALVERYRMQLSVYAHVLQAMLDRPVDSAHLYFFSLDIDVEVDVAARPVFPLQILPF